MNGRAIRRWVRRVWVTAGLGFTAWLVWNVQAHGVPRDVTMSDAVMAVESTSHGVRFVPTGVDDSRTALIFLPGGGVDPDAYLPLLRSIADTGFPVELVTLPWRLAPTTGTRANLFDRIAATRDAWAATGRPVVLAGHSLGARLAGTFAARGTAGLDGLILIGTTHPRDDDLSRLRLPVLKILGDRDCVAPVANSREHANRLPPGATWVVIPGANHAQFGHYGSQINDCRATISREAQQARTRDEVVALLSRLSSSPR